MWWITQRAHGWKDRHPKVGWLIFVWPYVLLGVGGIVLGLADWSRTGGKVQLLIGISWLAIGVTVMVTKRRQRL